MTLQQNVPIWSRDDSFPARPTSASAGEFGFINSKGEQISAENMDDLVQKIGLSRNSVDLVWISDSPSLLAPEEVPELRSSLWKRRCKWAQEDQENGKRMCLLFGAVTLWYLYSSYRNTQGDLIKMLLSPTLGISGIMLLMFGLLPLYEGWKTLRKGKPSSEDEWIAEADESRFDYWLYRQKVPATYFLMALLIASGLGQLYLERSLDWSALSVNRAGLFKDGNVEWWRYVTAPFLHGNLLHWIMNASALLYLGRRVELLARWPHVIIVMFGAALAGVMATSSLVSAPSVGASGGIMGLLGFLLVFETCHARLVPKSSRRRLIAGVITTVLMGVIGFQFIDNAAHAGGLVAGMAYAIIGFPASKSPRRPAILKQDRWIALILGGMLLGGLLLVFTKLFI